jgi:hypothetical protein
VKLRRTIVVAAVAALVTGCGDGGGGGNAPAGEKRAASRGATAGGAPGITVAAGGIEHVPRAFYPRPVEEDFWETVPRSGAGAHFLLHVATRIKSPAEGPWTITFLDPAGAETFRQEGLRVDTATGLFTFLCETARFAAGDWTIRLEVAEGGLVAGPRERLLRFRVE